MTMEITNCEQYVLSELDYEQRRNERLAAENNKLAKQLDAMTKRANGYSRIINRPKTPIEALADKVMREEMLTRFTYAEVTDVKSAFSGRLLDFDEWCHDAMRYVALADDVGEEEFTRFMHRDLKKIYDEKGNCLVAVSEGIHYADGSFVSEAKTSATDGFGHAQLGGLASMLADTVKNELGCKVRGIELSLLQRCAAHCASKTDVDESYMSGKAAVENAVAGKTDYMPGFKCTRDENGYKCEIELLPLSEVANTEKKVPRDWINEEGNGVTQAFVDYALPLIEGENVGPKQSGLPRFAKLKKIKAEA